MKREVYYREYVIPASEVRAASPTDDPYYDMVPDETWEADLIKIKVDGWERWARVSANPAPFPSPDAPGQVRIDMESTDARIRPIFRTAWEPVTVLRPVSTPPF